MSELAAAVNDIKAGTDDCAAAMHEALQQRVGFPITLVKVAYLPPTDSVRVRIRPESDGVEAEHQLSRGDDDLDLATVQGSLTFEFD